MCTMGKTKIAWTDETWNVCTGRTKASRRCTHCYADWEQMPGARNHEDA